MGYLEIVNEASVLAFLLVGSIFTFYGREGLIFSARKNLQAFGVIIVVVGSVSNVILGFIMFLDEILGIYSIILFEVKKYSIKKKIKESERNSDPEQYDEGKKQRLKNRLMLEKSPRKGPKWQQRESLQRSPWVQRGGSASDDEEEEKFELPQKESKLTEEGNIYKSKPRLNSIRQIKNNKSSLIAKRSNKKSSLMKNKLRLEDVEEGQYEVFGFNRAHNSLFGSGRFQNRKKKVKYQRPSKISKHQKNKSKNNNKRRKKKNQILD